MSRRHRNASDSLHGRIVHWLYPKRIPVQDLILKSRSQSESACADTENSQSTQPITPKIRMAASEPSVTNSVLVSDSESGVVDVVSYPRWARLISPLLYLVDADEQFAGEWELSGYAIRNWILQVGAPLGSTLTEWMGKLRWSSQPKMSGKPHTELPNENSHSPESVER